jgi:chromosome partitioning protein
LTRTGSLQQSKKAGIDPAIIDTAPHSDSAAATAAQLANFVLMPCRSARFDLDAIAAIFHITSSLVFK